MKILTAAHLSRKSIMVIAGVLFILLSAVPAPAQERSTEIVAGVPARFPPHYQLDRRTGQPSGFAVDVMDEVARRSGLTVRYRVYPDWPAVLAAMKSGEIDVIPDLGITPERTAFIDFTVPYETFNVAVFVRAATLDIKGAEDLTGRSVAVVTDNVGLSLMEQRGGTLLQVHQTQEQAFMALLAGEADALVYPEPVVRKIARELGIEERIRQVGKPLAEVKRAIGVRKGRTALFTKLDTGLKAFIETPAYREIYKKWYGTPEPYWTVRRTALVLGALLLAAIAGLVFWRYRSIALLNKTLRQSITERKRDEEALQASLRLSEYALTHSLDELLTRTLDEAELLTGSRIGFFHFLEADQRTLLLQSWSTNTIKNMCTAAGKGRHYPLDEAGVWADAVRQRRPAIHNDYAGLPNRKGLPPGHAQVIRELVFPIIHGGVVIGILGVGNKPAEYDEQDIQRISRIGNIAWDIVLAKRAEEALRKSDARFQAFMQHFPGLTYIKDSDGRVVFANEGFSHYLGLNPAAMTGKTNRDLFPAEFAEKITRDDRRILESGRNDIGEEAFAGRHWITYKFPITSLGTLPLLGGLTLDITERKAAEQKLALVSRLYTVLFKVNEVLVRLKDPEALYEKICRIVVEDGLFRMAWIGIVDPETLWVNPVAKYGAENGYLTVKRISANPDLPEGRGQTGIAIRSGAPCIVGDMSSDPHMEFWREEALRRGYRSSAAFPLREGELVVGSLNIYAEDPHFFKADEIQLLEALAGDVSYALAAIESERQRRRADDQLRDLNEELEEKVTARTAELTVKIAEIERINRLFVGRELAMAELKKRNRELESDAKRREC